MKFTARHDHVFVTEMLDGVSRSAIKSEFESFLESKGLTEWDIEYMLARLRIERVFWSNNYNGFTHDCEAHINDGVPRHESTCFPDAKEDTVLLDLPPTIVAIVRKQS